MYAEAYMHHQLFYFKPQVYCNKERLDRIGCSLRAETVHDRAYQKFPRAAKDLFLSNQVYD